ncbi:MAG TPA: NB-ARC domain-containing protein, partial [Candidatus Dormibacteraeota bacterium]|nr:NB-ARC domain-containing protein [Candidatus Dormibacteraeota bacterium]
LHLEADNYRDFTIEGRYSQAFAELLGDLRSRNGIELKQKFRQTYVTAPPLPINFVERPEALSSLRDAVITDDGGRHIALTALEGMGGIGKTVLAQALCHDEVVQQAFPDCVIWIAVGKESTFDVVTRMREVGKALGDDLARYDNELGAKNQYRSTIRSKAAIIVVDDVWRASDLEPLRAESPRSRLLFTTRDASIAAAVGAREHIADR